MNTFKKIANVFGWFVVLFLFCFGLYGGWQMTKTLWPGLHEDAALYSTVAVNLKSGFQNQYDVYTPALILAEGKNNFTGHGQLYYPIISLFMADGDYESLLKVLHISNLLGFILTFAVFFLAGRLYYRINCLGLCLLAILGSYGIVGILHYIQGRPEHGIPFVLLIFLLVRLLIKKLILPNWLSGVQIGIVAAISPVPGAILGFASIYVFSLKSKNVGHLIRGAFVQTIWAAISWIVINALISKDSISNLFKGIIASGRLYYFNLHELPVFWFKLSWAPGLGILLIVSLIAGFILTCRFLISDINYIAKGIHLSAALLLSYFVFRSGIGWPAINYSLIPFFPSVVVWLMENSKNLYFFQKCAHREKIFHKALALVLFVAMAIPGLGYLRTCFFQSYVLSSNLSYGTVLERIAQLKSNLRPGENIMIDDWANARSAVIFDGPPWQFKTKPLPGYPIEYAEQALGFHAPYYFVLQSSDFPPERNGFDLMENSYNQNPVTLFGIQIKGHTPGYGYAIYSRKIPE
jgi:hypothetical protein